MMKDRKSKAKLIILLGVIWVIITLPLPWIYFSLDPPLHPTIPLLLVLLLYVTPINRLNRQEEKWGEGNKENIY